MRGYFGWEIEDIGFYQNKAVHLSFGNLYNVFWFEEKIFLAQINNPWLNDRKQIYFLPSCFECLFFQVHRASDSIILFLFNL